MRREAKSKTESPYSTALVTGASSGMGRAFAEVLKGAGIKVYGTSRKPRAGEGACSEWLSFEGGTEEGLEAFLESHREVIQSVDILVNNAGSSDFGDLVGLDRTSVRQQWQLLFHSPALLTREALGPMRSRGKGIIINVSSLAAIFPLPWMSVYAAAKAALSQFTQSLQLTETHSGVRLVDFQPGDFKTAFNEAMSPQVQLREAEQRAWNRMEALLQSGPDPQLAARDLMRAIGRRGHLLIRSGPWFQTRFAPLGLRLLSNRCLRELIRRYYGLHRS